MPKAPELERPAGVRVDDLVIGIGERTLLRCSFLEVAKGGSLAVMGPSGTGKTSLLNCLAGVQLPRSGRIRVASEDLTAMRAPLRSRFRLEQIGMVYQLGELLPELTVWENVALPLMLVHQRSFAEVDDLLAKVGMGERGSSMPFELSGGEVQRVAIARALAGSPSLILADEPTGALDEVLSIQICELLQGMARSTGAALIVATHDPIVAEAMDRLARIRDCALASV